MKRYQVSWEHVIWAYEDHICDLYREGKTVAQIRAWLRDDWSLHVGEEAVRAVLQTHRLLPGP
jgi:hypothetical protein